MAAATISSDSGPERQVVPSPVSKPHPVENAAGRTLRVLLPLPLARAWARLERAGLVIVLLLIFALPPLLGEFGIAFDPIREGLNAVLPWALRVVLFLSGHPLETGSDERFL